MKHLVLGSAGQIGGHLCNYLEERGEKVITFDIKNGSIYDLREQWNELLYENMKQCDFVYFLAYDVGGAKYLEKHQNSFSFIDNNMKIMCNTFNQLKIFKKPFIFASSQMSELNHSSYGQLKSLGEKMTYDLKGSVARFWNVYGIEPVDEHSHVITDLCKMAKYERFVKVRTDGTEKRQFTYADDASEILFNISQGGSYQKRIDITSGEWVSIKDVAYIIAGIAGLGTEDVYFTSAKDQTQKDAQNEAEFPAKIKNYTPLYDGIVKIYENI